MEIAILRQSIDRAALTSPVRNFLNCPTAEVGDWDVQPVGYAAGLGHQERNLFRVSGHAHDRERTLPWTLILKVRRPPPGARYAKVQLDATRPPYGNFWPVEPLAYHSGLLSDLPGIAAPRSFGVMETVEGTIWLWLEDVQEEGDRVWPLERYSLAARHFGNFNGAYLTGSPLPTYWWLSRGRNGPRASLPPALWLDPAAFIERDETWDHSVVRRAYPVPIVDRLRRCWADYDMFYAALQRLPRTLCHFDAFRPNLLARRDASGHDQTVAIDWETVGVGAIGEELGAMVLSTLGWFEIPGEKARDLGEAVFAGYLSGLRDAGWTGDAALARLGFTIAVGSFVIPASAVHVMVDPVTQESWLPIWGRPLDEFAHQWALMTYYLLELADEARQLLERL